MEPSGLTSGVVDYLSAVATSAHKPIRQEAKKLFQCS